MTDAAIDPSSLPLQTPAPDASVRHFTETVSTALAPEAVWAEFTRSLMNSQEGALWPNEVSTVRVLQPSIAQGSVIAERVTSTGTLLHYRLVRFEPSRFLLEYASLQGHHLAGGAVVSVESHPGVTTLRWKGEYRGSEVALGHLDRFRAAFFSGLARQFQQLEASRSR